MTKKQITLSIITIACGLAFLLTFFPRKAMGPVLSPTTYTPQPPAKPLTTIFFGGDIMLSRNVDAAMSKADDYHLPFQKIATVVKNASIAFANLESPFNDKGDHSIDGSLVFNADPKNIEGLTTAGLDILSTANNHSEDQSDTGIDYTYNWLRSHNILPIGTMTSCRAGQIISKNNIKFGFLAYSYTAFNAGKDIPDPKVCDAGDLKQLTKDIQTLRPQVDYLVVSTHMGIE